MRAGNFAEALRHLDAAQGAGVRHTRLYYNRGVCLYRLERFDEAELAFEAVAMDQPMAPMAYFNLGLISERRGDATRARQWFERVLRETDDENLRTLARRRLSESGETESTASRASRWSGEWSVALGYDSNVTVVSDELATGGGAGDTFLDLYGAANLALRGSRRNGLTVGVTAEHTGYREYSDDDFSALGANLYYRRQWETWSTRAGALVEQSYLSGDGYQWKTALRIRLERELSAQRRLSLGYDVAWLDDLDTYYRHLSGTSQKFRIDSTWARAGYALHAGYALELNDRDDLREGAAFTSYSATRHGVGAGVRVDLAARWTARLDADYRYSRYNEADRDTGGNDLGRREDRRWRTSARLSHPLGRGLDLVLEWRFTNNESNVAERTYHRMQTMLGLEGRF